MNLNNFFILENNKVVHPASLQCWAEWWENPENWIVKQETILNEIAISTVFLQTNMSLDKLNPKHFETMVMGGGYDMMVKRWGSWDEAYLGHISMVENILHSKFL